MGAGRYIGHVGALAVALGVGTAIATGVGSAVAQADSTGSSSDSNGGGSTSAASGSDTSSEASGHASAASKPKSKTNDRTSGRSENSAASASGTTTGGAEGSKPESTTTDSESAESEDSPATPDTTTSDTTASDTTAPGTDGTESTSGGSKSNQHNDIDEARPDDTLATEVTPAPAVVTVVHTPPETDTPATDTPATDTPAGPVDAALPLLVAASTRRESTTATTSSTPEAATTVVATPVAVTVVPAPSAAELADRQAIEDLLVRFATGVDNRDWRLLRTVWTRDVTLNYGAAGTYTGANDVVRFFKSSQSPLGNTQHRLTSIVVDVDGDTATARTYVDAVAQFRGSTAGTNTVGYYDDTLVRGKAGWDIAERTFTVLRVEELPPGLAGTPAGRINQPRSNPWQLPNRPQDQQAIEDVLLRHGTGLATGDWDLYRSMFTANARVKNGQFSNYVSADQYVASLQDSTEGAGTTMARLSNMAIDVNWKFATARTYVDTVSPVAGNATGTHTIGYFDDKLVLTPDGWKITKRVFTALRSDQLPPALYVGGARGSAPKPTTPNPPADQRAIEDVLLTHATALFTRDWDLYRSILTEDGVVDYSQFAPFFIFDPVAEVPAGVFGPGPLNLTFVDYLEAQSKRAGFQLPRLTNMVIDVEGDTATARTYVDALTSTPDNVSGSHTVGYYDDVLVRTADGWKIQRRTFSLIRTDTLPNAVPVNRNVIPV